MADEKHPLKTDKKSKSTSDYNELKLLPTVFDPPHSESDREEEFGQRINILTTSRSAEASPCKQSITAEQRPKSTPTINSHEKIKKLIEKFDVTKVTCQFSAQNLSTSTAKKTKTSEQVKKNSKKLIEELHEKLQKINDEPSKRKSIMIPRQNVENIKNANTSPDLQGTIINVIASLQIISDLYEDYLTCDLPAFAAWFFGIIFPKQEKKYKNLQKMHDKHKAELNNSQIYTSKKNNSKNALSKKEKKTLTNGEMFRSVFKSFNTIVSYLHELNEPTKNNNQLYIFRCKTVPKTEQDILTSLTEIATKLQSIEKNSREDQPKNYLHAISSFGALMGICTEYFTQNPLKQAELNQDFIKKYGLAEELKQSSDKMNATNYNTHDFYHYITIKSAIFIELLQTEFIKVGTLFASNMLLREKSNTSHESESLSATQIFNAFKTAPLSTQLQQLPSLASQLEKISYPHDFNYQCFCQIKCCIDSLHFFRKVQDLNHKRQPDNLSSYSEKNATKILGWLALNPTLTDTSTPSPGQVIPQNTRV